MTNHPPEGIDCNNEVDFTQLRFNHRVYLKAKRSLALPNGEELRLRAKTCQVFEQLACRSNEVVSREDLAKRIWGDVVVTDDALTQCIREIRKALGDTDRKVLETIPRQGYMLHAVEQPASNIVDTSNAEKHSPALLILLVAVTLLILGVVFISRYFHSTRNVEKPNNIVDRLAVMRFNTVDEDIRLGEGFAEDLISQLARNQHLTIMSRYSSFSYSSSHMSAKEISESLGVRYLVDGKVRLNNEELRATVNLYDSKIDGLIDSYTFTASDNNLNVNRAAVIDSISSAVLGGRWDSKKTQALDGDGSSDLISPYVISIRTMARKHTFKKEEYLAARNETNLALEKYPDHALLMVVRGWLDFVDAASGISGELDPQNFSSIYSRIKRGAELDPESVFGWQAMSLILVSLKQSEEAVDAANRALKLAPNDPDTLLFLARALLSNGDYPGAQTMVERAQAGFPVQPTYFLSFRSRIGWANKKHHASLKDAKECLAKAVRMNPCRAQLIVSLYQQGLMSEAEDETARLIDYIPNVDAEYFVGEFATIEQESSLRRAIGRELIGKLRE